MLSDKTEEYFFVIASQAHYSEFREQLMSYGLREFEDFIDYRYFIKKIAIVNCNCYGNVYEDYLKHNEYFMRDYVIAETPRIAEWLKNGFIPLKLLNKCQLLITQDVAEDNEVGYQFSAKYLKAYMPDDSQMVIVPNLVRMGQSFFPNLEQPPKLVKFFVNHIIDEYLKEKVPIDKMIHLMKSTEFYSYDEIMRLAAIAFKRLKMRERNWSIAISDFLESHLETDMLFYDTWHPTELVMHEICDRLVRFLGYPVTGYRSNVILDFGQEFMMNPLLNKLGLSLDTMLIRRNSSCVTLSGHALSFEEYVKEYIYYYKYMY